MMKRFILFFALGFFLIYSSVVAQQSDFMDKSPEERAKIQTAIFAKAMTLTDSTLIEEFGKINLKYARKVEELANSEERRRAKFRQLKAIGQRKDAELKKLFTDEQFDAYQEKKRKILERMRQKRQSNTN